MYKLYPEAQATVGLVSSVEELHNEVQARVG